MLEYVTANLSAHECNVSAHPYVQGLPPMSAYAGLGHALERKLRALGRADIEVIGIAPAIGHVSASRRMVPLAFQKRDHRARAAKGGRLAPKGQTLAQIRLGLMFAVESDAGVAPLVADGSFARSLSALRLSGGTLWVEPGDIRCRHRIEAALADMPPYAFAIEDRTDELGERARHGEDALDTLVRLVEESRDGSAGGMRMPVGIGYVSLDAAPVERESTRQSLPHVFAEPVVGLGRPRLVVSLLKALREARTLGEDVEAIRDRFFWQFRSLARRGRDMTVRSLNHVYPCN